MVNMIDYDFSALTPGLHDVCPGCGQCQTPHPGRYHPPTHDDDCALFVCSCGNILTIEDRGGICRECRRSGKGGR